LLVATAALLAALDQHGTPAVAALARGSGPVQALLIVAAVAVAADTAYRLLAYAAVTPGSTGRLAVQASLEARRLAGEGALVPSRALAPALAAALALAALLGSAAQLAIAGWDAVAGGLDASQMAGRALGRDLIWALAGGVWCGYVGVTGMLAGYALSTGAAREPVRAPEIITGTWNAGLQVMKQPKPAREEAPDKPAPEPPAAEQAGQPAQPATAPARDRQDPGTA
jgi:hypothetical protein